MAGESGVEAAFSRWMMRANVTCRLKEEVLTALGKEGMRWHASESKNVRCVSFPKKLQLLACSETRTVSRQQCGSTKVKRQASGNARCTWKCESASMSFQANFAAASSQNQPGQKEWPDVLTTNDSG